MGGTQLNPRSIPGHQEYVAAIDFLSGADALLFRYEDGGVPSPRAILNLTFLGLEIALKCHIRRFMGEAAHGHDITDLFGKLRNDVVAGSPAGDAAKGYAECVRGLKLPADNKKLGTLDDVFALLTQQTFGRWRYVYERTQKLQVGQSLRFPFFNVYLCAWIFAGLAAKEYRDVSFPSIREYPKMPMWFDVERRRTGVRWKAETRPVMFGKPQGR